MEHVDGLPCQHVNVVETITFYAHAQYALDWQLEVIYPTVTITAPDRKWARLRIVGGNDELCVTSPAPSVIYRFEPDKNGDTATPANIISHQQTSLISEDTNPVRCIPNI